MNTQTTTDPVRRTITVKQSVADAFTLFTGRIGAWWPPAGDPASPGPPTTPRLPVLEPRPGGRIYDRSDDGTIIYSGEVLVWEPPQRLVLAWQPTRAVGIGHRTSGQRLALQEQLPMHVGAGCQMQSASVKGGSPWPS